MFCCRLLISTGLFRTCKTNIALGLGEKFANFNKFDKVNELCFFDNFNSVSEIVKIRHRQIK